MSKSAHFFVNILLRYIAGTAEAETKLWITQVSHDTYTISVEKCCESLIFTNTVRYWASVAVAYRTI